jgi:hypothetical protein
MVFASVPVQGGQEQYKQLKMRNDARKGSVGVVKRRSEDRPGPQKPRAHAIKAHGGDYPLSGDCLNAFSRILGGPECG